MKNFKNIIYVSLLTAIVGGCNGQSADGLVANESASSTTTFVKKIISAGVGLNFNNLTGGQVELVLNPTTGLPAILYYDRSQQVVPGAPAGALKYAYMDLLGNWNIEIVDSNYGTTATCGAATAFCIGAQNIASTNFPQIFDLIYVPAIGTAAAYPVVAYAHGNSAATGKRIRLGTRNAQTGIWSLEDAVPTSAIPAGIAVATLEYPIKGINITADDAGRIHLYFGVYETTLINSRLKYTMRSTAGTWTTPINVTAAGYTFLGGPPTIGGTTGVTSAEAVQCPSTDLTIMSYSEGDNTPANGFEPWILACTAVDTSGACTTWAGLDMIAGCSGLCLPGTGMLAATTNAGGRATLDIDPSTEKIIYAAFSTAIPNLQTVTAIQGGTDTCAAFTTTAWSTQLNTTASYGVNGVSITATTSNSINSNTPQFLMLANTAAGAATAIAKTNKSPFSSTWTAGNTNMIETAAASFSGSLKFDSSSFTVWGAYSVLTAGTAGTVGHDVKVFSAYESDIVSTGYISHTFVDQTMSVFPSAVAPVLDAAVAANETVGYAYFFTEPGAAGPNSKLYYGVRAGPTSAPAFGEKLVYNSNQGATTFLMGQHPSLDYDTSSNPVIAFHDALTATRGFLMLAKSSDKGTSFAVETVDGAATGNIVGTFSSVDVHTDNAIGISYFDSTNLRLKFAKKAANGSWRRFFVDGPGASCGVGTTAGSFSRFKWTSSGQPVIAYQATIGGIRYLRLAIGTADSSALNYTWSCLTLDSSDQAANNRADGIDLEIDSAGLIHIAHQDSTAGRIRYVTCANSVSTCVAAGSSAFTGEIVDSVGTITANSSRPAIAVSDSQIYVAYYSPADFGLYLKSKSKSSTSSFQYLPAEAIETPNSGNLYVSTAGQYARMLINEDQLPMIFYRSNENWLKYFSKHNQ